MGACPRRRPSDRPARRRPGLVGRHPRRCGARASCWRWCRSASRSWCRPALPTRRPVAVTLVACRGRAAGAAVAADRTAGRPGRDGLGHRGARGRRLSDRLPGLAGLDRPVQLLRHRRAPGCGCGHVHRRRWPSPDTWPSTAVIPLADAAARSSSLPRRHGRRRTEQPADPGRGGGGRRGGREPRAGAGGRAAAAAGTRPAGPRAARLAGPHGQRDGPAGRRRTTGVRRQPDLRAGGAVVHRDGRPRPRSTSSTGCSRVLQPDGRRHARNRSPRRSPTCEQLAERIRATGRQVELRADGRRPAPRRRPGGVPDRPGGTDQRGAAHADRPDPGRAVAADRRPGRGWRSSTSATALRDPVPGHGLVNMRERARLEGGELEAGPGRRRVPGARGPARGRRRWRRDPRAAGRRRRPRPQRSARPARRRGGHHRRRRGGRRPRGGRAGPRSCSRTSSSWTSGCPGWTASRATREIVVLAAPPTGARPDHFRPGRSGRRRPGRRRGRLPAQAGHPGTTRSTASAPCSPATPWSRPP